MTATATRYSTREEWLVAAVGALTPLFETVGETVPALRVSVGWPGGKGKKRTTIGQCWAGRAATDGVAQIFVSPVLDDAARVLDVLAHEIVHAVDDCQNGHGPAFGKIARAIGLEGKLTATVAGEALAALLAEIAADLGAYPHAALANPSRDAEGEPRQSTRMLKVECAGGSGYIARLTQKWLSEYGEPLCPCHEERMVRA